MFTLTVEINQQKTKEHSTVNKIAFHCKVFNIIKRLQCFCSQRREHVHFVRQTTFSELINVLYDMRVVRIVGL